MSEGIMLTIDDNGVAHEYDDKYDIVIHCTSRKQHEEVIEKLRRFWAQEKEREHERID